MDKIEKHCIRTYKIDYTDLNDKYIYVSVPGICKEIHLINCGIHRPSSQNLFSIDFGGLLPDGINVFTHSTADNSFLNFYDLKFDYYGRIDGQFKITARFPDGTTPILGSLMIYLRFTYE